VRSGAAQKRLTIGNGADNAVENRDDAGGKRSDVNGQQVVAV